MNYYPMPYQPQYAGPIISQAPSIPYSPISYSSSPPDPYISYSYSPSLPSSFSSFTQPSQPSQPSQSSSFSTFPSTATFASTAFTAPATAPTSSFDAFGIPVAPVTPATPATPATPDTQATQDTPDTPVNTDDKEHIFINIIVDKDSNNINNSTVVKKKEIDIKGELNKYTDYTFYIIITDKDKKKFYLYAEDSYNKSTISENAREYDGILKGYKVQGDYCIIIYEKNCLIVWYNTEIDKNDIYKKIENKKLKDGQPNLRLDFISPIADKQNIMHNFLSNYVSTRFLENKFFKLIQNFSNSYIMNFIKELDTCNGKSASDRSLTSGTSGTSSTTVSGANFGEQLNSSGENTISKVKQTELNYPEYSIPNLKTPEMKAYISIFRDTAGVIIVPYSLYIYPPEYKGPFLKDYTNNEGDLIVEDKDDRAFIEALSIAWEKFIRFANNDIFENTLKKFYDMMNVTIKAYEFNLNKNLNSNNQNIVNETNRIIKNIKEGIEWLDDNYKGKPFESNNDDYDYDRRYNIEKSDMKGGLGIPFEFVNKYGYPLILAYRYCTLLLKKIYKKETSKLN